MSMIHNLLNEQNQNDDHGNNEVVPSQQNRSAAAQNQAPVPQPQISFTPQPYDAPQFQAHQHQQQWTSTQPFQQSQQQQQQYPTHTQPFQPLHPQQQFYQAIPGNFFPPQHNSSHFQQQQHPIPPPHQQYNMHHQLPQRPKQKRRRTPNTTTRRRTMTACESCRLRKIKCDLGRPTCGACIKSDLHCVYRNIKKETDELSAKITKIVGMKVEEDPKAPSWSTCNWYTKAEGVLKWPIYENKYHVRPLNTVLAENNGKGLPQIGVLSKEELNGLNTLLKQNITAYIDGYLNFIQTKNPFIDSKALLRTSDFIKNKVKQDPNLDLFTLKLPEEMIPLSLLILCSASACIARPLTFKNLVDYRTSTNERLENTQLSYKLYILAQYLNIIPTSMIETFNLDHVQFYLLKATYLMYIIKPLEAWSCVYKASTLVMTILESYKSSGRKFTEVQHRLVERVFHTCVKYESEFRVELSPSVPSSGVVNYPFPSIYPSPPVETINSVNEESSWFFYLTEIVLRKFENRLLDEFFVPTGIAGKGSSDGEFLEDKYDLGWDKYDFETVMTKSLAYLEDLGKIETSMISHLRSILKEDPTSGVLQPHGFLFKTKSTLAPTESKSPSSTGTSISGQSQQNSTTSPIKMEPIPLTPSSDSNSPASSDLSQRAEKAIPDVPETINFIRTRMIVLKVLLFRPLVYLLIHDRSHLYDSHPFVEQVLTQCFENIDTLNIPLACHRHFGSWFYARNTFLAGILIFGLFKRFREKYVAKGKIEQFMKDTLIIIDYWIDEVPDLVEPKNVVLSMLEELKSL